jgi:L-asparagine transporter-like permease
MYLQKLMEFVTHFYHTQTPYAIAILVVLVVLLFARPKTMAKLVGFIAVIVTLIYIAGLLKGGIDSGKQRKSDMTQKTEKQLK